MNIENTKNVWLFGAKGFIGSHVFDYFSKKCNLYSIGRDYLEYGNGNYLEYENHRELLFELYRQVVSKRIPTPDVIVYSAGSGSVPISIDNPIFDFERNVSDYYLLLSIFRGVFKNVKIIYLSSAAVYGSVVKPSHTKDSIFLDKIASPYGLNKYLAENAGMFFSNKYGLKVVNLRLFSVYGTGLKKQIGWDLFNKVQKGQKVIALKGTGQEKRDWVSVIDVVHMIEKILSTKTIWDTSCLTLNCGTGRASTVKDYARIFCEYYDLAPPTFTNEASDGDPGVLVADMNKEINMIGWSPEISLEDGIIDYINWLENDK